jgi:phosphate butyryltransferase
MRTMQDIVKKAQLSGPQKLVVAVANDEHVIEAVEMARKERIIEPILVGDKKSIIEVLDRLKIAKSFYELSMKVILLKRVRNLSNLSVVVKQTYS